jgi:hypothetical protein
MGHVGKILGDDDSPAGSVCPLEPEPASDRALSGRPAQRPSSQKMHVEMKHRLPRARAHV